jgi:lysyl-tRNA synthetase class 2
MSYSLGATAATLRLRAGVLARIRAFFAARGVLEVETPALSSAGLSDLALESVTAHARSLGGRPLYLHTSPEYAMKRLLASGSGDIYQLARVFRDDELGRWHQPEFTLLEWYRVGWDEVALMTEVELLLRDALAADPTGEPRPLAPGTVRITYGEACVRELGIAPTSATPSLGSDPRRGIDVPAGLSHDAVLISRSARSSCRACARRAHVRPHYPEPNRLARGSQPPPVAASRRRRHPARERLREPPFAPAAPPLRTEPSARSAGRAAPPLDEELLAALERPPCAGLLVDRLSPAAGADRRGCDGFAHVRKRALALRSLQLDADEFDADDLAFVDEQRQPHDGAALELRGLLTAGSRVASDARVGLDDLELDVIRRSHVERHTVPERDDAGHLLLEPHLRVGHGRFAGRELLEGVRLHEVEEIAVVVQVLHVLVHDVGRFGRVAGLERALDDAARLQVSDPHAVERLALAGLHVLVLEDRVRIAVEQDLHPAAKLVGAVNCHGKRVYLKPSAG